VKYSIENLQQFVQTGEEHDSEGYVPSLRAIREICTTNKVVEESRQSCDEAPVYSLSGFFEET
jgi:hypothetical protein